MFKKFATWVLIAFTTLYTSTAALAHPGWFEEGGRWSGYWWVWLFHGPFMMLLWLGLVVMIIVLIVKAVR